MALSDEDELEDDLDYLNQYGDEEVEEQSDEEVAADLLQSNGEAFALQLERPVEHTPRQGHPLYSAALPRAKQIVMTVKELYDMMLPPRQPDGQRTRNYRNKKIPPKINVNPQWQRDSVWTLLQSSKLVQSLYENYHVPQLVFNVFAPDLKDLVPAAETDWDPTILAKSSTRFINDPTADVKPNQAIPKVPAAPRQEWTCNDGKQRLTAIRRFIEGEIPVIDSNKVRWFYTTPTKAPKSSKVLSQEAREAFDAKVFTVARYDNLSEAQERELFQRVQEGRSLTPAEKLKALGASTLGSFAEELRVKFCSKDTEDEPHYDTFNERVLKLDHDKDWQSMLEIILNYVEERLPHRTNDVLKASLVATQGLSADDQIPNDLERLNIIGLLTRFQNLTLKPRSAPGNNELHQVFTEPKLLAPVEFVIIPSLLRKFSSRKPGELLEIIEKLRILVNQKYAREMKKNTKVYEFVQKFMDDFNPDTLTGKYQNDGSLTSNPKPRRAAPVNDPNAPLSRLSSSQLSPSTTQHSAPSTATAKKVGTRAKAPARPIPRRSSSPEIDDLPLRMVTGGSRQAQPQASRDGATNALASGSQSRIATSGPSVANASQARSTTTSIAPPSGSQIRNRPTAPAITAATGPQSIATQDTSRASDANSIDRSHSGRPQGVPGASQQSMLKRPREETPGGSNSERIAGLPSSKRVMFRSEPEPGELPPVPQYHPGYGTYPRNGNYQGNGTYPGNGNFLYPGAPPQNQPRGYAQPPFQRQISGTGYPQSSASPYGQAQTSQVGQWSGSGLSLKQQKYM